MLTRKVLIIEYSHNHIRVYAVGPLITITHEVLFSFFFIYSVNTYSVQRIKPGNLKK